MWRDELQQLALLELWATGFLRSRRSQASAWDELALLPWTRRTGRRNELALNETHRSDLEVLLDRSLPDWRERLATLEAHRLPPNLNGWKRLRELQREVDLPPVLPERLNQRTATAALGTHSKASLGDRLRKALGPVRVTHDGLIRMRPSPGLLVSWAQETWSAERLADGLGELAITERALRDGTTLTGTLPRALLLVENVGCYIDIPAPDGWLVAHLPGWNSATVRLLLAQLPAVPVVHFGDLDPNGVRIARHLREIRPDVIWAVPDFWAEQIPTRGQLKTWPEDLDLTGMPELVQRLAALGVWLEQEPLALDPRILGYLGGLA